MTTIKNIARPCGDCWTRIEETTPMFRLCCWADEKKADTGKNIWGHISCIAFRLSQIDIWPVLMYLGFVLDIACIVSFMVLNAANGYQTYDTIKTCFRTALEALTHSQTVLQRGPETAGYLYVIGLF